MSSNAVFALVVILSVGGVVALVLQLLFARAVLDIIRDKTMEGGCAWIHYLCSDCFFKRKPGRQGIKLENQESLPCCNCGLVTSEGTWYRPSGAWQDYPRDFRCADYPYEQP